MADNILKFARKQINCSRKLVTCKRCSQRIQFRCYVDHVLSKHPDIDVVTQCIFCLHRFKDNQYERHFRICFKKSVINFKMMHRQREDVIETATAQRVLSAEQPARETIVRFETRGTLPSIVEWEHVANLVDCTKQPIILKNTTAKDILVTQEMKPETLRLATNVLLSFHPNRWYHLIVCKRHVSTLQGLLRERTDMFVPDFGCWCMSLRNIDRLLHYHMLLYTENPNWKREIWNRLESNDRNRYKLYRAIKDPKHLCNVLHYISQTRPCGGGKSKHFDIQRPISGEMELLIKLVNPVIFLEGIYSIMPRNIAHFDLHKMHDQHNSVIYYTPLKSIMNQMKHFNLPIVRGHKLELTTDIGIGDFTLTYTQDGRYVNAVPGNSTITVAKVLDLLYPKMNVVWSKRLHTTIHNMFVAAQDRCPRCFPVDCGITSALKFVSIEKPGEVVLVIAVKRIQGVVQVALYGKGQIILNVFVHDNSFYLNGVKQFAINGQQLKEYLLNYFECEERVTLMAKDEQPFRFLRTLLCVPANVKLVNAKPILADKFKSKKNLNECTELLGYYDYDLLVSTAYEAKLLYELLTVDV